MTGADKITSSVSFHIKELRLAGLVTVERRGKNMICGVNRDAVAALAAYLGTAGAARTRRWLQLELLQATKRRRRTMDGDEPDGA